MSDTVKYLIGEEQIPKAWYNIAADLPQPLRQQEMCPVMLRIRCQCQPILRNGRFPVALPGVKHTSLIIGLSLERSLNSVIVERNRLVGDSGLDWRRVLDDLLRYAARLRPWVADVSALLAGAMRDGRRILFAGKLGSLDSDKDEARQVLPFHFAT